MSSKYQVLTESDVECFMKHGYVHLTDCFNQEKADNLMKDMWIRLGLSPESKSWPIERCNMAPHSGEDVKTFAPKVWKAMCDLLGGGDRINGSLWSDSLVVNLGDVDGQTDELGPRELDGWHVDGDFFTHFLDSPEQGLLVVPLLTDVLPGMGPTISASDSIPIIAQYLYDHPEGVTPRMTPKNSGQRDDMSFFKRVSVKCDDFVYGTGKIGDCYLLHPLILHTASRNTLRIPRVILNPAVSLIEPFNFSRSNPEEYSLVERATLAALGRPEGLGDWKITGKREHVTPARIKLQARLRALEDRRLAGEICDGTTENGLGGRRLEEVNALEIEA